MTQISLLSALARPCPSYRGRILLCCLDVYYPGAEPGRKSPSQVSIGTQQSESPLLLRGGPGLGSAEDTGTPVSEEEERRGNSTSEAPGRMGRL